MSSRTIVAAGTRIGGKYKAVVHPQIKPNASTPQPRKGGK